MFWKSRKILGNIRVNKNNLDGKLLFVLERHDLMIATAAFGKF